MKTVLLTGATRGLGLAIARALDAEDAVRLVLAVRDRAAGEAVAKTLRRPARVVTLDTGSFAQIRAFARSWSEPIDALINNAGLQNVGPIALTPEGVESTIAVNHLGPLLLATELLPRLDGGLVMAIGSGTHNPDNTLAARFGFRGGRFTTIEALARGECDAQDDRQRGLDRYATSKLCTTVTAMELAKRHRRTRFVTFDPGLMPGTGLARTAPWAARMLWSYVAPLAVRWLDDASTPERSAATAARLALDESAVSGEVYAHDGVPSHRVWSGARDAALSARVLDESLAFLAGEERVRAQGGAMA